MAYDRSIKYGTELIGKKAEGFEQARRTLATLMTAVVVGVLTPG